MFKPHSQQRHDSDRVVDTAEVKSFTNHRQGGGERKEKKV